MKERRKQLLRFFRLRPLSTAALAVLALVAIGATVRVSGAPYPLRPNNSSSELVAETGYVRDASLLTATFGWALTTAGLQTTHDSGQTWTTVTPPNVDVRNVRAVSFASVSEGWGLATQVSDDPAAGVLVLYHTTDGGTSWSSNNIGAGSVDYTESTTGNAWMDFLDASNGWIEVQLASGAAFSRATLFRTSDGGNTWSQLTSPAAGPVAFLNPEDGWIAGGIGDSQLFATHDGGKTWSAVALTPTSSASANDVSYSITHDAGVIGLRANVGNSHSALLYSLDSSDTWQLQHRITDASIQGQVPPAPAVTAISSGSLVTTTDGGKTIVFSGGADEQAQSSANLPRGWIARLSFADSNSGWAVVANGTCSGPGTNCAETSDIYATSDGGANWSRLDS